MSEWWSASLSNISIISASFDVWVLANGLLDTAMHLSLSNWWLALLNIGNGVWKLLIVSLSDLLNSGFAVESHSNGLVGLNELVELLGEFFVLEGDHTDVVVQGINFYLKVGVVIKESRVAVSGTLKLFSHVHNLIFLRSDLDLQLFNAVGEFDVSWALGIDSLLKINIFISIFLLKNLQMVKFILETNNLIFQLDNFSFTIDELALFVLQVTGLGINELVEVINSSNLLGDVVLESSCLGSEVWAFLTLHLILVVELVNFLGILLVSFSEHKQLLFKMLLLGKQLRVEVLMLGEVALESRDLNVSAVERLLLHVQLRIEVGVLLLSINEETLLIINFLSEGRDHRDVGFNSALIIILHSSLVVSYSVKVLLQVQEIVLQNLVFSLPLSKLHCFLSELCYKTILMVLGDSSVI